MAGVGGSGAPCHERWSADHDGNALRRALAIRFPTASELRRIRARPRRRGANGLAERARPDRHLRPGPPVAARVDHRVRATVRRELPARAPSPPGNPDGRAGPARRYFRVESGAMGAAADDLVTARSNTRSPSAPSTPGRAALTGSPRSNYKAPRRR